jgi:hypothetical protein
VQQECSNLFAPLGNVATLWVCCIAILRGTVLNDQREHTEDQKLVVFDARPGGLPVVPSSRKGLWELARRQGARPVPPSSPMILYSVYVLIALALGECGAIDRSADPKGKLQLTVF